ncbi:MAG: preprotein translocase subunit SecA [Candidatus Eremiobacterota bacterium]
MLGLLKGIFDSNLREVKKIEKVVEKINAQEKSLRNISESEMRARTSNFRERLAQGQTLDDILPEAFALVREASWQKLNMRHFDVQMVGGIVLHQGRIAEMRTGEGKTLVATSPLYLNALEGTGVHLITVNDYLARRDARWMGPIYHALGLSVGIINHDVAYLYDPSVEIDDDSLRHLRPVSRREAYQADITYGTNNEYGFDYLRDNMVWSLDQKVQRGLNYAIVDEVDSILIDEARTPLIISGRGRKSTDQYQKFAKIADRLVRERDYTVEEKAKSAPLTEDGVARVEEMLGVQNLYDFENSELAHYINNAMRAKECYRKDIEYVVRDGEIVIVDEFTGRLMFGRRYSDGLHQAIEAKEGVKVRSEDQTLASITFQNYFKMYKKLAGMTGTAATEEREFREIYNVDVVVIPTNKQVQRKDYSDLVYKDEKAKFDAVVQEIVELNQQGRPVLVGTRSIEKSEQISLMLKRKGIKHEVLNAKHHEREAQIIAQAGAVGAVTIATNMAGRGVDIILGGNPPDEQGAARVRELGGLHILGTERHESRRIDNQLRGRSGRQGDPGSSRFYVGLDDELMRLFGSDRIKKAMEWLKVEDDVPIESSWVTKGIENAQQKVEGHHFDIRKNVLKYDNVMNEQRRIIYEERDRILRGEALRPHVLHFVEKVIDQEVAAALPEDAAPEDWDLEGLFHGLLEILDFPEEVSEEDLEGINRAEIRDRLVEWANAYYHAKAERLGEELMQAFEKHVLLQTLDEKWIDHLESLDQLREGIGLRGYGQKDPQIEFIREAFEEFEGLKQRLMEDTVRLLFKLEVKAGAEVQEERTMQATRTNRDESSGGRGQTVRRLGSKIGRNDPCWCGSGKKWKKCHYPAEN